MYTLFVDDRIEGVFYTRGAANKYRHYIISKKGCLPNEVCVSEAPLLEYEQLELPFPDGTTEK